MSKGRYLLKDIVLQRSFIERNDNDVHGRLSEELSNSLKIDLSHVVNDNILYITLRIFLKTNDGNDNVPPTLNTEISMVGIFEVTNTDNIQPSIDDFSKLNGPAIILPFVRQHLADLIGKAGFKPFYIPPINFYELMKNN